MQLIEKVQLSIGKCKVIRSYPRISGILKLSIYTLTFSITPTAVSIPFVGNPQNGHVDFTFRSPGLPLCVSPSLAPLRRIHRAGPCGVVNFCERKVNSGFHRVVNGL